MNLWAQGLGPKGLGSPEMGDGSWEMGKSLEERGHGVKRAEGP